MSPRDIVYTLPVGDAYQGNGGGLEGLKPRVLAQTDLRCGGVSWCDGDLALVRLAAHRA